MADFFPFRRPGQDAPPVHPAGATIALPVMLGCAGRCGKVTAVHWPTDPQLGDLQQELRRLGWVLATAEMKGLPLIGIDCHATAPLCGDCARGEQVRAGLATGRVPTLQRGR